jgi:hypothetical protein
VYVESAKSRQARRARRAARVLEFARSEEGRRIVPYLTLEPPEPEEAAWVGHYLGLADQALENQDLENPAERKPRPVRRRA